MAKKPIELIFPEKQGGSELDYSINIASEIEAGDDISQVSAFVRPSGAGELRVGRLGSGPVLYVTKDNDPETGDRRFIITTWLADGVAGRGSYTLRLLVTLASGRVLDILALVPISNVLAHSPVPKPPSAEFSDPVTWNGVQPFFFNLSAYVLAATSAQINGSATVVAHAS
jgi:hypothetical protein